jgi:hypothetical protein
MPDCVFAQPKAEGSPRNQQNFAECDGRLFVRAQFPVRISDGTELRLGVVGGRRRRNRVQRHVDDGGDASRDGGLRGREEPFPLRAARLVDVHVGVDDARRDEQLVRIDARHVARRSAVEGRDVDDAPIGDVARGRTRRPRINNSG